MSFPIADRRPPSRRRMLRAVVFGLGSMAALAVTGGVAAAEGSETPAPAVAEVPLGVAERPGAAVPDHAGMDKGGAGKSKGKNSNGNGNGNGNGPANRPPAAEPAEAAPVAPAAASQPPSRDALPTTTASRPGNGNGKGKAEGKAEPSAPAPQAAPAAAAPPPPPPPKPARGDGNHNASRSNRAPQPPAAAETPAPAPPPDPTRGQGNGKGRTARSAMRTADPAPAAAPAPAPRSVVAPVPRPHRVTEDGGVDPTADRPGRHRGRPAHAVPGGGPAPGPVGTTDPSPADRPGNAAASGNSGRNTPRPRSGRVDSPTTPAVQPGTADRPGNAPASGNPSRNTPRPWSDRVHSPTTPSVQPGTADRPGNARDSRDLAKLGDAAKPGDAGKRGNAVGRARGSGKDITAPVGDHAGNGTRTGVGNRRGGTSRPGDDDVPSRAPRQEAAAVGRAPAPTSATAHRDPLPPGGRVPAPGTVLEVVAAGPTLRGDAAATLAPAPRRVGASAVGSTTSGAPSAGPGGRPTSAVIGQVAPVAATEERASEQRWSEPEVRETRRAGNAPRGGSSPTSSLFSSLGSLGSHAGGVPTAEFHQLFVLTTVVLGLLLAQGRMQTSTVRWTSLLFDSLLERPG